MTVHGVVHRQHDFIDGQWFGRHRGQPPLQRRPVEDRAVVLLAAPLHCPDLDDVEADMIGLTIALPPP
jgi:hypothetical protein